MNLEIDLIHSNTSLEVDDLGMQFRFNFEASSYSIDLFIPRSKGRELFRELKKCFPEEAI